MKAIGRLCLDLIFVCSVDGNDVTVWLERLKRVGGVTCLFLVQIAIALYSHVLIEIHWFRSSVLRPAAVARSFYSYYIDWPDQIYVKWENCQSGGCDDTCSLLLYSAYASRFGSCRVNFLDWWVSRASWRSLVEVEGYIIDRLLHEWKITCATQKFICQRFIQIAW